MAQRHAPIDISDNPEWLRLVEEMRRGNGPRELHRADEVVAVLAPPPTKLSRKRALTAADREAFRAAAGGWKDLRDTGQSSHDTAAGREIRGKLIEEEYGNALTSPHS